MAIGNPAVIVAITTNTFSSVTFSEYQGPLYSFSYYYNIMKQPLIGQGSRQMKEIYKFLLHARNELRHLKCILIWSLQQLHETGSIPDLIQTLRLRGIHKTNDKLDPSNGPLSFSSHFVSCRYLHVMRNKRKNNAVTLSPLWMGMELHQTAVELSLCL